MPDDPNIPSKAAGRPLKPFLECSDRVEVMSKALAVVFATQRLPRKADSEAFRTKCLRTLELLCLNLTCLVLADGRLWLQTPASKTWYAENRFWIGEDVTAATVATCTSFPAEQGYVVSLDGSASPVRANRRAAGILPTETFKGVVEQSGITVRDIWRSPYEDLIQLRAAKQRDGSKRRISFAWNDDLIQMRENLKLINAALNRANIGLNVTSQQWRSIMEHIGRKYDPEYEEDTALEATLDLTQRTLYRVFNNGTFDDGGRFYGAWYQAVPKKWRSYITINGSKVVEVDYAAMHPTVLSHKIGLPVPARFYEIGFGTKEVVKATFNALINARGTSIRPVAGFSEARMAIPWEDFLRMVKERYSDYREFFGSGYGLKLQRLDSNIADAVMVHFVKQGKVVLPVHDSFLCAMRDEAELVFVMEEEFRKRTGGPINLRRKRLSQMQIEEIRARRVLNPPVALDP